MLYDSTRSQMMGTFVCSTQRYESLYMCDVCRLYDLCTFENGDDNLAEMSVDQKLFLSAFPHKLNRP